MLIKGGKSNEKSSKEIIGVISGTYIYRDRSCSSTGHSTGGGYAQIHKSIALMKGEEIGYVIINSVRSDKVLGLKSSNTNVVSVRKMPFLGDYTITLKAKKTGTSIVSFKVKRKNGKTYSFKSKVTVHNYKNPLNVCKFGRKIIKNPLIKRPWFRLRKVIPERQKYVSLQRRATR